MRGALVAALASGLVAVARVAAWPVVGVDVPASPELGPAASYSPTVAAVTPESLRVLISRDPFRVTRRPAATAYDPRRLAEQLASPPPARPVLTLVGIASSAEPAAVIEGFPGVEGSRVVRVGDVVAGLRIKQIAGGRVVIVGLDTTWGLTVREPWKP